MGKLASETSRWEVNVDGLGDAFGPSSSGTAVRVVTVFGQARQGKSFLMNR